MPARERNEEPVKKRVGGSSFDPAHIAKLSDAEKERHGFDPRLADTPERVKRFYGTRFRGPSGMEGGSGIHERNAKEWTVYFKKLARLREDYGIDPADRVQWEAARSVGTLRRLGLTEPRHNFSAESETLWKQRAASASSLAPFPTVSFRSEIAKWLAHSDTSGHGLHEVNLRSVGPKLFFGAQLTHGGHRAVSHFAEAQLPSAGDAEKLRMFSRDNMWERLHANEMVVSETPTSLTAIAKKRMETRTDPQGLANDLKEILTHHIREHGHRPGFALSVQHEGSAVTLKTSISGVDRLGLVLGATVRAKNPTKAAFIQETLEQHARSVLRTSVERLRIEEQGAFQFVIRKRS
ncbi:hypothetical protein KJ765_00220 [Candidatus Micrarchaeota archaeon]|nr:hypothetical protein [Candidatus Micrarchaeota archaeon]